MSGFFGRGGSHQVDEEGYCPDCEVRPTAVAAAHPDPPADPLVDTDGNGEPAPAPDPEPFADPI